MAKRTRGRKQQKTRRPRSLGALGLPPDQHANREAVFSGKMGEKFATMQSDLKDPNRCEFAFGNLIDLSVYGGMAEAEAEGSGKSGSGYARKVADAMAEFKRVCKVR